MKGQLHRSFNLNNKRAVGRLIGLSGAALVAAFFIFQTATAAPPSQGPVPVEKPSVSEGAALWTENCLPCHGTTGQGDGPTAASIPGEIPDFTDPELAHERTLAGMFDVIANGRMDKLMPPWKNRLSEDQMWSLAAYVQSLSVPSAELEAGQAVYAEACAECHGVDGVAAELDLTQPAALIDKSPQLLFDELRSGEGVHAPLNELSDEALWQSLAAVQTLSVEMPVFDGVLRGQVRNGTTGELVPNSELTLYGLSPTGQVLQTKTTTADENGDFVFEKLNREHTISYAVEGEYNDISYISQEPALFVPDETETQLDLVMYESTDDPSAVSQSRLHRIIAFDQGQMVVADVYIFVNEGDRTFIGKPGDDGQPQTVEIALPPEALEPNFQPATVRQLGSAYASSQPIIPGEEAVVSVSYSVPFDGDRLSLTTPLLYDVPVINILAAEQGETISSELLIDQGVQNFQGNNYHLLNGADLKAGQSLVLELGNLDQVQVTAPQSASGSNVAAQSAVNLNQTILLWTLLGLGLAVIAFSLYYSNRTELQTVQQTVTLQQEKDHLLGKLKALESLYHSGEINEQAYRQVKNRNRASLKQILAQLHEREF